MTQKAIALPFAFDPNGGISSTYDERKIWQDRVVLVVMTLNGERVMRNNFGTQTRAQVMETQDLAISTIKAEIAKGFSNWLSALTLENVDASIDQDYIITMNVKYSYGSNKISDTVVIKTDIFNPTGDTIIGVQGG